MAAYPIALGLALLAAPPAAAQGAADPGAASFFPLEVGSVFDYASDTGDVLRRTVAYDTLVVGAAYAVVADTVWDRAGQRVRTARYAARFDAETSRVVVWDGAQDRPSAALAPCPTAAGPSVECETDLGPERRHVTEGGGALALAPGSSVRTRTYASEVGFGVLVLAEGIGPVLAADLRGVYTLCYARVGGVELGTPGRPALAERAAPPPVRLRVWPNPTAGRVTLRYEGAGSGPASADVFDALGRRVLTVPIPDGGDVRQLVLDVPAGLSRGVYTVRVGGAGGASVRFVRQ